MLQNQLILYKHKNKQHTQILYEIFVKKKKKKITYTIQMFSVDTFFFKEIKTFI